MSTYFSDGTPRRACKGSPRQRAQRAQRAQRESGFRPRSKCSFQPPSLADPSVGLNKALYCEECGKDLTHLTMEELAEETGQEPDYEALWEQKYGPKTW